MNTYDFEGKVAMVTGGGRGIGQCVIARLREGGAKIAAVDLDMTEADNVDIGISADVRSLAAVRDAAEHIERQLGHIDVLVCAAGIMGAAAEAIDVEQSDWDRVLAVNVNGTYNAMRAVLPGMVRRGYGRIVNIASIAAREGLIQGDAYAASKAAVVSITRTVGRDYARSGVLINCVIPALTDTAMAQALSSDQQKSAKEQIPLGRLIEPTEVATMIAFLATEDMTFSTGACFDVSGGRANY